MKSRTPWTTYLWLAAGVAVILAGLVLWSMWADPFLQQVTGAGR